MRRRRPANRRELILEAAVELFHRHGYPATSVDDIGKAVDVSGPAIYRHFSSKEDLLVEAITLAADEVHAVNRVARADTDDPRALLTGYIRAYTDVALERSASSPCGPPNVATSAANAAPMGRRLRSWTHDGPTPSRPLVPNSTTQRLPARHRSHRVDHQRGHRPRPAR